LRLDRGPVRDDRVLAHDDDAVLDDVALILVVSVLHVVLVDDLAVHADARVLVDDRAADGRAGTDADRRAAREGLALVRLLVVVSTHDHGVLDHAPLLDGRAEADHGVGDDGLLDEAAVTDGGAGHVGVEELAGGQEAGLRVDGGAAVVERELRLLGVVAVQVRVVERLNGTDILPVAVVQESLDVHAHVLGGGDDLAAEVVGLGEVLVEQRLHRLRGEDVDAHGRDEGHLLGALLVEAKDGGVHRHRLQGVALGLLREVNDATGIVDLHETERRGALLVHGDGGDSDVGANLAVLLDEGAVVHAVQVVTGEDDVLVALGLGEEPEVLAHGISGALEPVLVHRALLRGENLDETLAVVGADVAVVRLGEVTVERRRVELRKAVDLVDVGVDAVGHGDVDEAVVGAERNRGLGAGLRQGVEAGTRAAAKDDRQHVVRGVGHLGLIRGGGGHLRLDGDRAGGADHLRLGAGAGGSESLAAEGLAGAELGRGGAGRERGRRSAHGDSLHLDERVR